MPWPKDRLERVAVNSFGIGGANAHVILESAASWGVGQKSEPVSDEPEGARKLLLFSAKHQKSLERSAQKHEEYLTVHPDSLGDMAYTLNTKREVHPFRAFCVTDGLDAFQLSRVAKPTSGPNSLVFTFTGQGAQWARMGRELLLSEGMFKQTIEALDATLAKLPDGPEWTLRGMTLLSLRFAPDANLDRRDSRLQEDQPPVRGRAVSTLLHGCSGGAC